MRILYAEDELQMSRAVCAVLQHNHFSVDAVYDGQDALDYALEYVGADRLLHGSDMPGNYLVNLGQVIALDIDEESRAKILGGNAKRLFDRSFRL